MAKAPKNVSGDSAHGANPGGADSQSIEVLQARFSALHTRKIQAETNLDNARRQLEQLKREAQEKYGSDDINALREKLAEMTADNEQKRKNYQAQLDRIEGELLAVEQKFSSTDGAGQEPAESAG